MSALMYILIAGILGCILAMFVVALRDNGDEKPLPPLTVQAILDKKGMAMNDDLGAVCQKLGLSLHTQISLALVVDTPQENKRRKLRERLQPIIIPFVLTDPRSSKPVMAILPAEFRDELGIRVLDLAKIPFLHLNNYNLPGLEKAIRDKLGSLLAPPPQKEQAEG